MMQDYRHLLLLNVPISLRLGSGDILYIKTPSIEEFHSDSKFEELSSYFDISLLELQLSPESYGFIADNYLDLFIGLAIENEQSHKLKGLKALEQLCGVTAKRNGVFYGDYSLTEDEFDFIREVYMTSLNKIATEDEAMAEQFDERQRELEERINKLKNKGATEEERSSTWIEVVLRVVYELKIPITDIKKLNYFGLIELAKIAARAPEEKIGVVAAGNGLTKDYKNITQ